jgi:hypothetical protein
MSYIAMPYAYKQYINYSLCHQVFSQLKWQGNKNYLAHFVKLKDIRTIAYPFSAMRQTKGHRNNDTPLNRFDVRVLMACL